jgi:hypothetical protein
LEEVLVVTRITEKMPDAQDLGPLRASDILAERLPTVPNKTEVDAAGNAKPAGATAAGTTPAGTGSATAAGIAAHPATPGTGSKPGLAGTTIPSKPVGAATTLRTTQPGASTKTNGTVKPKATIPANGRAAGTAVKPSNNNAVPAATTQRGQSGTQDDGEAFPPAKKQVKRAPESAPNAPSEQPSTPPAGAPPQ